MDVTKLFDNREGIEPLSEDKVNAMITNALAHPQHKRAANENFGWTRRAMAIAAAVVIAVTISLNLIPASVPLPKHDDVNISDVYDEMSEMMIFETLNDLS